jgi:hypothetical protein
MPQCNEPCWYQILRYWIDVKRQHALAFSFLVGATRTPIAAPFLSEQEAKEYSIELYRNLKETEIDRFIAHIHGCKAPDGPMVTLEYGMRLGSYQLPSFEELWQFFGAPIASGEFSFDDGCFRPMTDAEKQWVLEATRQTCA